MKLRPHYGELTTEETDEVVNAVADLIVDYIKGGAGAVVPEAEPEGAHEREHPEDIR
jgi:hypothetical protein